MKTTETRLNCDLCGAIIPDEVSYGVSENNPSAIIEIREDVYYGGVYSYYDFCNECGPKLIKLIKSNFPKKKAVKE